MVSEELVTSPLRCCTSVVGFFVPTTPDRLRQRNFTILSLFSLHSYEGDVDIDTVVKPPVTAGVKGLKVSVILCFCCVLFFTHLLSASWVKKYPYTELSQWYRSIS